MDKASIWRRLKLFFEYRRILKDNEKEMEINGLNLKLDWVNRVYTVFNIPPEKFDEPYNIRKGDVDKIAENYIVDYVNACNLYFQSKGLNELITFDKPISKVDKYSFLIVFGFSQMDNVSIYRNTVILTTLLSIAGLITFLVLHH